MTNHLTVIRNNSKIAALQTSRIENALKYSKEDTDLFFYMLAVIADKHTAYDVRNQAWKYLNKQDKLQNILNDLIARLELIKTTSIAASRKAISKKLIQLNHEIEIFNEIHFRTKRTYFKFANEYFEEGLGRAFMVA